MFSSLDIENNRRHRSFIIAAYLTSPDNDPSLVGQVGVGSQANSEGNKY